MRAERQGHRPDAPTSCRWASTGARRCTLPAPPDRRQMADRTPDWVVLAVPADPAERLYLDLRRRPASASTRVGDCVAPRRAHAAVIEGERVGAACEHAAMRGASVPVRGAAQLVRSAAPRRVGRVPAARARASSATAREAGGRGRSSAGRAPTATVRVRARHARVRARRPGRRSLAPLLRDADVVVLPASPDGRDLAPAAGRRARPAAARRCRRGRRRAGAASPAGAAWSSTTSPSTGPVRRHAAARRARRRAPVAADRRGRSSPRRSSDLRLDAAGRPVDAERARGAAARRGHHGPGRGAAHRRRRRRAGSAERLRASSTDVAVALGASMGATRVVTDRGWVGHERQIGTTGVVVDPDLYVAFGISRRRAAHRAASAHPDHVIARQHRPALPDDGDGRPGRRRRCQRRARRAGRPARPVGERSALADATGERWATMPDVDVIVVGAGPAGSRRGAGAGPGRHARSCLLERGPVPRARRTCTAAWSTAACSTRSSRTGGRRRRSSAGSPAAPR